MHRFLLCVLLCASAATACGDATGPQAGAPAELQHVRGNGQTGLRGGALDTALVVRLQDEDGAAIAGAVVSFAVVRGGGTIDPAQARTTASGTAQARWVLGNLVGTEQLAIAWVQRAGGPPLQAVFTATATPTGPIAAITALAPALLTPGAMLTVSGGNLHHVSSVTIAGVTAPVLEQSSTTLRVQLPEVGFGCAPTGGVPILLAAPGGDVMGIQTLRVAPQRPLPVGGRLIGSAADPLACIELPAGGGRYVITVANVSADTSLAADVLVRGIAPAALPGAATAGLPGPAAGARGPLRLRTAPAGPATVVGPAAAAGRRRALRHATLWRASASQLEQLQGRSPIGAGQRAADVTAEQRRRTDPAVGDTIGARVPRLTGAGGSSLCTVYDSIRARVIHVGERAVVVEDVGNPLAGSMDSLYSAVADEFDARQFEVLRENFGEPLRNGTRVLMVFTDLVNDYDVTGFVWAGDFAPRALCAQSNETEVFYGYVPTSPGDEYGAGTRREWDWTIRATIMHETKHLAGMVQRLSTGGPPEELWLEEATAMVAEEIWARAVFGYEQYDNVDFESSVGCEIDGAFERGSCAGRPGAIFGHFVFLADWMEQPAERTLLGPTAPDDVSFYGSGWLFLRWLLDTAARPEAELLRELAVSAATGIANVEGRFGRTFADMLPQWAAAVALDDRATAPAGTGWTLASWNLRDVFSGLNREQPELFPTAYPLRVQTMAPGGRTDEQLVHGGGAAYFELSGGSEGAQAVSFEDGTGAALHPMLRVVIVRLD